MTESKDSEKRQYPRVNFPCDFTLWPKGENEEVIMGNAANVSAGGLCAYLYKKFDGEETGEITINSPHLNEPISCWYKTLRSEMDAATAGEWKNYYKVVVYFLGLEEEKRIALAALVNRLIELEKQRHKELE